MKKLSAALVLFIFSTGVFASLVSIDFETSEGYPTNALKGLNIGLSAHGWDVTTGSTYTVPYTSDTFANTGSRSANVLVSPIVVQSCYYDALWTPSAAEPKVIYSGYVAFKKANVIVSSSNYGGLILTGTKADSSEVVIGKITLNVNGTVSMSNANGYSASSTYSYSQSKWYQLSIKADYSKDTVEFLLNGVSIGSTALSSDIVSLSSIGLTCGASGVGGYNVRYDTLAVNTMPEPTTMVILGFGILTLIRNKK
jgi:hypothetical protein